MKAKQSIHMLPVFFVFCLLGTIGRAQITITVLEIVPIATLVICKIGIAAGGDPCDLGKLGEAPALDG